MKTKKKKCLLITRFVFFLECVNCVEMYLVHKTKDKTTTRFDDTQISDTVCNTILFSISFLKVLQTLCLKEQNKCIEFNT